MKALFWPGLLPQLYCLHRQCLLMLGRASRLYKIATVNGFSAPLLAGLVSCVIVVDNDREIDDYDMVDVL